VSTYDLISVNQPDAWNRVLERCRPFDAYHLPGYHRVANRQGEGEPFLFVFEDRRRCAALPFLRRPVTEVGGLEDCGQFDAISAYGYPGVVTSARRHDPGAEAFALGFQAALREALDSSYVVSLFLRQNPLIDTSWLLCPMADVKTLGPTVAIDLRRPEEDQLRDFRKGHRYDVLAARKQGTVVYEAPIPEELDVFWRIYTETMQRIGADEYYYFSRRYLAALKHDLAGAVKLFLAEQDGNVIGGSLFLLCGDIIQYHLSGAATEFLKCRGGTKIILEEVRAWGTRNGYHWLHLGGGTGACEDSLFRFKTGFSKVRLPFQSARIVLRPQVYHDLVRLRERWISCKGYETPAGDYFPAYRRNPCAAPAA